MCAAWERAVVGPGLGQIRLPVRQGALAWPFRRRGRHRPLVGSDHGPMRILTDHANSVTAVAITPDGQRAVSGSRTGAVRAWVLATGRCLHALTGHTTQINDVALSADGHHAPSGSEDEALRWWDLDEGRCLHQVRTTYVASAAMTPTPTTLCRECRTAPCCCGRSTGTTSSTSRPENEPRTVQLAERHRAGDKQAATATPYQRPTPPPLQPDDRVDRQMTAAAGCSDTPEQSPADPLDQPTESDPAGGSVRLRSR
jgi:hypothetical protein